MVSRLSHLYWHSTARIFCPPPLPTSLLFATSRPVIWLTVHVVVVPSGLWAQDPFIRWYAHLQHMVCIIFISNSTRSAVASVPHSNPIGISWCCAYSLLMLSYCVSMHIRTHHARTHHALTHARRHARTHARTHATQRIQAHAIRLNIILRRWLCTMYGILYGLVMILYNGCSSKVYLLG